MKCLILVLFSSLLIVSNSNASFFDNKNATNQKISHAEHVMHDSVNCKNSTKCKLCNDKKKCDICKKMKKHEKCKKSHKIDEIVKCNKKH